MRTLKFNVNDQIIKQDPACDFSNIIVGSSGYLKAEFSFSEEWDGFVRVAEFRNYHHDKEPISVAIGKDNTCLVPDVTNTTSWRVRVIGKRGKTFLSTNETRVIQKRR